MEKENLVATLAYLEKRFQYTEMAIGLILGGLKSQGIEVNLAMASAQKKAEEIEDPEASDRVSLIINEIRDHIKS